MREEEKMYKLICEKKFDEHQKLLEEILGLLKGENGEPGVIDKVRDNSKAIKRMWGFFIFVGGAMSLQFINGFVHWICVTIFGG